MKKGECKFLRQKRVGFYAVVRLEVGSDCTEISIAVDCHGQGFAGQGYIEEVPVKGYDDWKQGAINGVKFALEAINLQKAKVIITHIEGLTTDTNPTIVAAASALALWNALEVKIPEETEKKLEDYVLQSWSKDESFVPMDNFLISK